MESEPLYAKHRFDLPKNHTTMMIEHRTRQSYLGDAISEAIDIAQKNGTTVSFDFNGTTLKVNGDSDPNEIMNLYIAVREVEQSNRRQ